MKIRGEFFLEVFCVCIDYFDKTSETMHFNVIVGNDLTDDKQFVNFNIDIQVSCWAYPTFCFPLTFRFSTVTL